MDLYNYKRMMKKQGNTQGEVRKKQSDIIMEATWDRDIQSKRCYIYDYFHDDARDKNKGFTYSEDTPKTPVDLKFIITQYGTLQKDQVEYHIQFKPSYKCNLPYFDRYEKEFQNEFPIGLFVDIPDDEGIYHRWLICSKEIANQFVKCSVLPCNYYFHWVYDNKKYDMWGVARLRSSYNSGQIYWSR